MVSQKEENYIHKRRNVRTAKELILLPLALPLLSFVACFLFIFFFFSLANDFSLSLLLGAFAELRKGTPSFRGAPAKLPI